MFEKAIAYIDKIIEERRLPLLDFVVKRNHKEIFRHHGSYNGTSSGKELLCMFSCTKVLTAVCAMRLVDEGKIALDDPVSNYIPEFSGAYTLNESGEKRCEVIRIRHLLTMSSGLDYKRDTPEIVELAKEKYGSADTLEVIKTLVKHPLHFAPGERFLYSLSHDVIGAVIEVVTGLNLADYMKKYIFDPLGMKNSTLSFEKYADTAPKSYRIIKKYEYEKETDDAYREFHPTLKYISGGAGLISTVEDYSLFADALASGGISADGYRLVSKESIELMKNPVFHVLNVKNTYTCVQGKDYGYGLGVRVRTEALECGIPVGEFGWDGAAGSYVLVDTDNGISITAGMNILNWHTVFGGEHTEIAKLIYEDLI